MEQSEASPPGSGCPANHSNGRWCSTRKAQALGASTDMGLVQITQAAAVAPAVTAGAAAAAGHPRPTKRHRSRAEPEHQQQQCLPMEQEFAGQYCANQEQYLQPQGMQWAPTAAVYSDRVQASMAAVEPEALLSQSLYSVTPTAAAAGDHLLQPPNWLAEITLAGHESSVDCVQQVLNGQLSVHSTDIATPEWGPVAVELEAAEELFSSSLHHNPLDLPGKIPWQLAGHQEMLATPPPPAAVTTAAIFVHGPQPWQQQQGASGASAAVLAAQTAACDILGCFSDPDLAATMQEVLAGHQAKANAPPAAADAAKFVQGQQPWQQQQQGASDISVAGLAAHGPAGDIFSCLTAASPQRTWQPV